MKQKIFALIMCFLVAVSMLTMLEIQPIHAWVDWEGYLYNWVLPDLYVNMSYYSSGSSTLYFRADNVLSTQQSASNTKSGGYHDGLVTGYWGIRVWYNSSGTEHEITNGTPVAQVNRSTTGSGLQSATWACPETALKLNDSVVVRVYRQYASEGWTELVTFATPNLNIDYLEAETWTVYLYTRIYWITGTIYEYDFYYGSTYYNSHIEDFAWGYWTFSETRDFMYNDTGHWWAKKCIYHRGNSFPAMLKLEFNATYNQFAYNRTYYEPVYLVVGMEDSNEANEGYDDLFVQIGVCEATDGYWYIFIDNFMGNGAYRKEVYREYDNGTDVLLFDYPTMKQRVGTDFWQGFTFADYLEPTIYPDWGFEPPSGENDTGHNTTPAENSIEETAMRLGVDEYATLGGNPEQWQYCWSRYRFEEGNPQKWWFEVFTDNTYYITINDSWRTKIEKKVIGFEDMSYGGYGEKDNMGDLVIVVAHVTLQEHIYILGGGWGWFDKTIVKKLDMVQCCGGLRKRIVWESAFDSGEWSPIFGENGYQYYEYDVILETTYCY